jgi:2-dehydro-3-deoxygluconokinase
MPRVVTFGEIMLRLKTPGYERLNQSHSFETLYGGGEANVAVSLANFAIDTEFVTRLPGNELGDACLNFLRQYGVHTNHILRGGDRLGIYFLEAGATQRPSKVLYDRAGSSFATIQPGMLDWIAIFKGAEWFHWTGITPAVSQGAAEVCKEAVVVAKQAGITISCDLNYRAKLWKWTNTPRKVMEELVAMSDIVIGNEEDAEKVFGIKAPKTDITHAEVSAEKYQFVCQQLAERMPNLKTIAITLRGSISASHNTWSGVLWQKGKFHQAPVYDILPIIDRVGGGDAFAAGLIYGFLMFLPQNTQKALNFAVAASCLKHSIPGDFNLVNLAEVGQLLAGDASGRVVR